MLGLTLAIALLVQVPSEQTVTLIFRDRTQTITLSEAKALYKTVDPVKDQALHVALTLALGTVPDHRIHEPELTPQERERFRWHRRPLQGK